MPFGHGVEVSITRNNNAERVFGIGARNATATTNLQFDGGLQLMGLYLMLIGYWVF